MFNKKYPVFLFCFILVGLMLPRAGFAQGIELKDVLKIRLVERWGGMSIAEKNFEIVNTRGVWKNYRTKLVKDWDPSTKGTFKDSSRVFVSDISTDLLKKMLSAINIPDTTVVDAHYNLSIDSLIKYTDTVHPNLTSKQKADFVEAVRNKDNIHQALVSLSPAFIDDYKGYYAISITTRNKETFNIRAQKWAYPCYLPWQYNNSKNYNPIIQNILFDIIGGKDEIDKHQQYLSLNIDKYIYRKFLETRFNWELFQTENPESYRILNNTVTPVDFVVLRPVPDHIPDFRESYILHSSRLPAYVNIYWNFSKTDTGNMRCFKRYEDTLAILFNQKSFLFDYMKNIKDGHLSVIKYSQGGMEEAKKIMYNNIKKYFASIEFYDPAHMHFFRVFGENGNLQHWIVFGDKALVLADYTGELKDGDTTEFKGITPDPNAAGPHKNLKGLCLVFDATGKRLGGTTDRAFIGWPF